MEYGEHREHRMQEKKYFLVLRLAKLIESRMKREVTQWVTIEMTEN